VPYLVRTVPQRHLMLIGGALAAASLAMVALHFSWQAQIAVYGVFGFGFYLLHSCIQVHVTDLSQTARGAAASTARRCCTVSNPTRSSRACVVSTR